MENVGLKIVSDLDIDFFFAAYLVNLMMFIFIASNYPMPHCAGQISRLCLRLGELYGSDKRVFSLLVWRKKSVAGIRKTTSKTTNVTRSYTKDQVNINR